MRTFSSILVLLSFLVATYLKNDTDMDLGKISLIYALMQCSGLAFLFKSIGKECNNIRLKWLIYYPLAWFFGLVFIMWAVDFLLDDIIRTYRIYISFIFGILLCIAHYIYTWYNSTR